MADSGETLRQQYDVLQATLSTRRSIDHFAHGAVSTLVGFIGAATTVHLWVDLGEGWLTLCLSLGAVVACVLGYATARWVLGARAFRREMAALETLRALRARLGLDDPRVMLPA